MADDPILGKDRLNNLTFLNTSGSFSYLTLAKGGYIIRINPMAIGILVVPELSEFQNRKCQGKNNQ